MKPQVKAALILSSAMLSFSLMGALVKVAGETIPSVEMVFFRGIVGLPLLALLARWRGISLAGRRRGLLLLRGCFGSAALMLFFYAIAEIPVGTAILLNQSAPIFVLLLAAVVLRERIGWRHALLVLIALGGVALVLRPTAGSVSWPAVAALVSAALAAVAYVLIRVLTASERSLTIVFWFTATATLSSLPLMLPVFELPDARTAAVLVSMGTLAALGQILMTVAYRHGEAGRLAAIGSLGAVFGAGWDLLLWSHLPDATTALGGGIAIAACAALQVIRAPRGTPADGAGGPPPR
jgi:drug/metabolite transporter (DMT)-like permease